MSIFDTGVKVGSIVYEVTRTFNGKPFRLSDHMERLYTGLKLLGIDCGMTQLDGYEIGDGAPGAITQRLIAAWSEMVGVDTIAQAKEYAVPRTPAQAE